MTEQPARARRWTTCSPRAGRSRRARSSPSRRTRRRTSTSRRTPTARRSGPSRPDSCTGTPSGTRCSTGRTRRSRSGSSAASSTSRTTASTGTSRPATATGWPSTGRASPATAARSPTPSCSARSPRPRTPCCRWVCRPATGSRSTCRCCPRRSSRCSPARGSGLTHSVVFGGFSAEALRSRIDDAEAKLVITADGQYRRGKPAPLKAAVDEAVSRTPTIEHVLVVRRTEIDVEWTDGRDLWWHDVVDGQSDTHTPGGVRRRAPAVHPLHVRHDR